MVWQQQVYQPKKRGPRIPKPVREEVLRRAENRCERCGRTKGRLTMHHIMPRSEGGGDNVENLAALCRKCHNLVEGVGPMLKTREMIRAGPAPSPPPKFAAGEDDWRQWVYGGARNPLHDK